MYSPTGRRHNVESVDSAGSNPATRTIFICREYLHAAVKTYAGDPSEAMQIATKWPFRDPAKMLSMREGHGTLRSDR